MAAPDPSRLDANQVLKGSFDEATGRLRTDSLSTIVNADIDVALDATEDNVAIADPDGDFLVIEDDGSINVNSVDGALESTQQQVLTELVASNSSLDAIEADTDLIRIAVQSIDSDFDVALSTRSTEATQLANNTELIEANASLDAIESDADAIRIATQSIDTDFDVALSTRASEITLSNLNNKVSNNYGVSSGAIRTASQIGNTSGTADFNAGSSGSQTLRTTSNITRNGTELAYGQGASDVNTLRVAANLADENGANFTNANPLPAENSFYSKLRIEPQTLAIAIPDVVYTTIYTYTGVGRLIGFNLEFNNSAVIVRVQIDGETVMDNTSLTTLNALAATANTNDRRQNGQGIVTAGAIIDFSFRLPIRFNTSITISATGNGAARTFNQGMIYISKE